MGAENPILNPQVSENYRRDVIDYQGWADAQYTPSVWDIFSSAFETEYRDRTLVGNQITRHNLSTGERDDSVLMYDPTTGGYTQTSLGLRIDRETAKNEYGIDLPDGVDSMSETAFDYYVGEKNRRRLTEFTLSNAEGFIPGAVSFAGMVAANAADPVNVGLGAVTGGVATGLFRGASLGTRVLGGAAIDTVVGGVQGVAIQYSAKTIGVDYSNEEIAMDAAFGGLLGAGSVVVGEGIARALDGSWGKRKRTDLIKTVEMAESLAPVDEAARRAEADGISIKEARLKMLQEQMLESPVPSVENKTSLQLQSEASQRIQAQLDAISEPDKTLTTLRQEQQVVLETTTKTHKQELRPLEDTLAQTRKENAEIVAEVSARKKPLKEEIKNARKEINTLAQAAPEENPAAAKLREQEAGVRKTFDQANKQQKADVKQLDQKIRQSERQKIDTENKLRKLEKPKGREQRALKKELTAKRKALVTELADLRRAKKAVKLDFADTKEALEKQLTDLSAQRKELKPTPEAVKALETKRAEAQQRLADLQSQLEQLETRASQVKERLVEQTEKVKEQKLRQAEQRRKLKAEQAEEANRLREATTASTEARKRLLEERSKIERGSYSPKELEALIDSETATKVSNPMEQDLLKAKTPEAAKNALVKALTELDEAADTANIRELTDAESNAVNDSLDNLERYAEALDEPVLRDEVLEIRKELEEPDPEVPPEIQLPEGVDGLDDPDVLEAVVGEKVSYKDLLERYYRAKKRDRANRTKASRKTQRSINPERVQEAAEAFEKAREDLLKARGFFADNGVELDPFLRTEVTERYAKVKQFVDSFDIDGDDLKELKQVVGNDIYRKLHGIREFIEKVDLKSGTARDPADNIQEIVRRLPEFESAMQQNLVKDGKEFVERMTADLNDQLAQLKQTELYDEALEQRLQAVDDALAGLQGNVELYEKAVQQGIMCVIQGIE